MTMESIDVLQGTLDLPVLKLRSAEPMHGWGISQRIQQPSQDSIHLGQGTLYPALHRLERRGLVLSGWGVTENNRRARYYHLTFAGREALDAELDRWHRYVFAMEMVLGVS